MASFTNQATLTYGGLRLSSNVVQGTLNTQLSVTKTALSADYAPGGTVAYAISIVSSASVAFDALTLTDDLAAIPFGSGTVAPLQYVTGSVRLFANGVPQPAPTVASAAPLQITDLSVPAGGNLLVLYQAEVTEFASPEADGQLVNTATLSGADLPEPLEASATVDRAQNAELTLEKEISPAALNPGDSVSYTFTLQNSGVVPAQGAVLEDTFDPVLTGLTVTLNGAAWAASNYSYDAQTGVFATAADALTVPAAVSTQDAQTGAWQTVPGTLVLTVTGTV